MSTRTDVLRWQYLLDTLFAVAVFMALLGAVMTVALAPPDRASVGWVGVAGVVVCVIAWLFGRRRHWRRWPALVAASAALVVMLFATSGALAMFLQFVTLAVLVIDVGVVAGVVFAATAATAFLAWGHFVWRLPFIEYLPDVIIITLLLVFGVGLGVLLRDLERSRATTAGLNRELTAANARLVDANDRLRTAAETERELMLADERARQARELHDGLGHQLTIVSMGLEFASRMRARDPERAWAEIDRVREVNKTALDEMRLWVRALDPPRDAAGRGQLDRIADAFRGTGLDVTVRQAGADEPLPDAVALFVTRLAQEGLTNVLKHARATEVEIEVTTDADGVRAVVADNGTAELPADPVGGFGLRSLAERAEALGGTLTASARPGGGFQLTADIPLAATG